MTMRVGLPFFKNQKPDTLTFRCWGQASKDKTKKSKKNQSNLLILIKRDSSDKNLTDAINSVHFSSFSVTCSRNSHKAN